MVEVDQDELGALVVLLHVYSIRPQYVGAELRARLKGSYGELDHDSLRVILASAIDLLPTEELRIIFPIVLGIDEPNSSTLSVRRTKAAYLAEVDVRTVIRREQSYLPVLAHILLVLPRIIERLGDKK